MRLTSCLALVVWGFSWRQSSGGADKIVPIGPKRHPQNGRGYSKKLSFYYQQQSTKDVKKSLHDNVLSSMKNDEISAIARKDPLIVNFRATIFEKVGTQNTNYVSQRMRQLARLLQTLRKENEAANFDDFIDTARFDELVATAKDLGGFKEESRLDIDKR